MKGIYLAACLSRHYNYNLDYNDIDTQFGVFGLPLLIELLLAFILFIALRFLSD